MLILDGIEYDVKTPEENVDDLITFINDNCETKGIKNSLGETIFIDDNEANPLYQLCFGLSYLTTIMQKLVYSAGCSMSLAESSPRQLLNLSDIAGIKRTTPTHTVIRGVVYANVPDAGAVDCVITQDMTATIMVSGTEITFHPAYDITIEPGGSSPIMLIAEEYGAYSIAANTITEFDDPVDGFKNMITYVSTPGQEAESIANLRARLQRRSVEGTQIDRAAMAIQNLEGVSLCNIYFNYSPSETETVPYGDTGITVAPRTALVLVQGWNNDIAKVFYRYLFCATSGADVSSAQSSSFITKAHQELTISVIPPFTRNIYIRAYIKNSLSYEQVDGIKDIICSLAGKLSIGQSLSSAEVINVIEENYSNLTVQGADLSLERDGTYSYVQTPAPTDILIFNTENISIVEV